MILILNSLTIISLLFSAYFFMAGTIGLLRFPDLFTRVHAPTKADNLGLGFLILSLIFQASSFAIVMKLILIWLTALVASGCAGQLISSYRLEQMKYNIKKDSPYAGRKHG